MGLGVKHSVSIEERNPTTNALHPNASKERRTGGLVLKARRLLYHSTRGVRVITKRSLRVSIDHFPKRSGPPDYHLRSIKRLKKKKRRRKHRRACRAPPRARLRTPARRSPGSRKVNSLTFAKSQFALQDSSLQKSHVTLPKRATPCSSLAWQHLLKLSSVRKVNCPLRPASGVCEEPRLFRRGAGCKVGIGACSKV